MLNLINRNYANRARRLAELRPNRAGLAGAYPFLQKSLRLLLICLGGLAGMSATACAQPPQAQLIKKALTVNCGERQYDVGFVSVRTTLPNNQPARALGIILSSPTAGNLDKVFCLYSLGQNDFPASHRDDDSGPVTLLESTSVRAYVSPVDDKTNIVGIFFKKAGCDQDKLADSISSTMPSVKFSGSLKEYLTYLNTKAEGKVKDSSDKNFIERDGKEFASLATSEAPTFGRAVHQFVISAWDSQPGSTPSATPQKSPEAGGVQQLPKTGEQPPSSDYSFWFWFYSILAGCLLIGVSAYLLISFRKALGEKWRHFRAGKKENKVSPSAELKKTPAHLAALIGKYEQDYAKIQFHGKVKSVSEVSRLQMLYEDLLDKLKGFNSDLSAEIAHSERHTSDSEDSTSQLIPIAVQDGSFTQPLLQGEVSPGIYDELYQLRLGLENLAAQQKTADEGRQVLYGLWAGWHNNQQYQGQQELFHNQTSKHSIDDLRVCLHPDSHPGIKIIRIFVSTGG